MRFSSFRGSPMMAVNVLSGSVTVVFVPFSTRGTSKFVGVATAFAASCGPPGPAVAVLPELHPHRGRRLANAGEAIEVRIERGPATIHAVEIERRRPHVVDRVRVLRRIDRRRHIERDVVIDELAEVRVARGDDGVGAGIAARHRPSDCRAA